MKKIKIGIVDDCEPLRISVCNTLEEQVDFEVTLQASNGQELINLLEHSQPDIVLMDIQMPIMDGIETTKIVRERFPELKVIAFSLYDVESNIIRMKIHGVKSFIGKDDGPTELIRAIRIISDGGAYLTDYVDEIIQKNLAANNGQSFSDSKKYQETEILTKLSGVERKILQYVADRMSMKEIVENLSLSPHTINNKQATIRKKFGLYGRGKLLEFAVSVRKIFQKNSKQVENR